jgi:uncharacterized protein DUF4440
MPMILALFAAAAISGPATPENAILAPVKELLEAWRQADNGRAEAVLHPDFRLTTLQGEAGKRKLHTVDRAHLLEASKTLKPGNWDDRLSNVAVRLGSNGLAVVTADYLFNQDGQPTHCGLVSFQLYQVDGFWKILSFADTHNNLDGHPPSEICPPSTRN